MIRWPLAALAVALGLVSVALGSSTRNGRIVFAAERVKGASGIVSVTADGRKRLNLTGRRSDTGPVASPNGRLVAFTRDIPSGEAAVYVMNADGSDQHEVAVGSLPSWAPDSSRIAYVGSDPNGPSGSDLSVMALATGVSTVLRAGYLVPVWSPDGTHIAAIDMLTDQLVVMRPDGSDLRVLASIDGPFSWSPDGTRIAYTPDDTRLRIANVADGTLDTVLGGQNALATIFWSPDGKSIAFTAAQPAGGRAVNILSLADGSVRTIEKLGDIPLAWSPDSRSLALLRGQGEIVVASVAGNHIGELTRENPTSYVNYTGTLAPTLTWSRSNDLFFQHVAGGDLELISIGANGRHRRELTNNYVDDSNPVWSPNGSQIAFGRNLGTAASPNTEIFVMSANGHNVHRLTTHPGIDDFPTWSPNGKRIAFVRRLSANDIGIVTVSPTGGRLQVIAHDVNDQPIAWSPNGHQFLLTDFDQNPQPLDASGRIVVVMPATGGGEHAITPGNDPDWSPDGKRIVFVRTISCGGECENSTLHIINANGSNERTVPDSPGLTSPHFSPDGRFIIATNNSQVVILDPKQGVVRTIPAGGEVTNAAWQPVPTR